jgi:transcriptional regulator
MYIPAAFREQRTDVLHAIIRDNSFAILVSRLNGELFATHMPFLLDASRGTHGTLRGHMARANPHWQAFSTDAESLVIFQGPHAYISPGWYVSEQAVPTWNYTAVHAYGVSSILDDSEEVRALLESTISTYERGLSERWSIDRVPAEYVANMMRGIVAFEIPIARLEGKRKLGQNRPAADILGAVAGLRASRGISAVAVAEEMSEVAGATIQEE